MTYRDAALEFLKVLRVGVSALRTISISENEMSRVSEERFNQINFHLISIEELVEEIAEDDIKKERLRDR